MVGIIAIPNMDLPTLAGTGVLCSPTDQELQKCHP